MAKKVARVSWRQKYGFGATIVVSAMGVIGMLLWSKNSSTPRPQPLSFHATATPVRRPPERVTLAELDKRFREILSSHPKREIRETLFQYFASGKILLDPTVNQRDSESETIFGFKVVRKPNDALQPTFGVNVRYLLDSKISVEAKWGALWHEYGHAEDYFNHLYPDRVWLVEGGLTEEMAVTIFDGEIRHYIREYEFFEEIRFASDDRLYHAWKMGGEQLLRIAMYNSLMVDPEWATHRDALRARAQQNE